MAGKDIMVLITLIRFDGGGLTFSMAYSMNPFSHSTASGSPERGSDELSLGIRMRFSTKKNSKLKI